MNNVELIQQLWRLPPPKQVEIFDFIEFLIQKSQTTIPQQTLAQSPIANWINDPLQATEFTPLTREEANAR